MNKKILFLTRKDMHHPRAGGAETVLHTYAKGLIKEGYKVTWISPRFQGADKEINIEGIQVKRMFSIHSLYFFFWIWYIFGKHESYDIIIDHAGGIPLLSPLYIWHKKIIFFTHHIGTTERYDYFDQRIGMGVIGSFFAWVYRIFVLTMYKNKCTITVSQGTARELQRYGFTNIHVLPNTTSYPIREEVPTIKEHILTSVGRVVPNKQFSHAVLCIADLAKKGIVYRLYIVGGMQDTQEVMHIKKLIQKLGLTKQVFLLGKISDQELYDLRDKTRYGLITSDKEGFGLTTLEANARGVPMIGYNISGVNEVIHDKVNGYLIQKDNRKQIVNLLIEDTNQNYTNLVKTTQEYIHNYPTWNDNLKSFTTLLT